MVDVTDSTSGPDDRRTEKEQQAGAAEASGSAASSRGRAKKEPPPFVAPIPVGSVVHLALSDLNLHDETYMFRAALRVGDLAHSLQHQGQQIPVIVRKHPTKPGFQIVSGFRRATAIAMLGWTTVAAIVRDLDDEAAFRASVLENTARKTYSDIDRAHVFKAHKDRGFRSDNVGQMMGLTKRQVNNLLGLLELPKSVQEALADPDGAFKATHALYLRKVKRRYPKLDYGKWIKVINAEALSVSQLTRRVNEDLRAKSAPAFGGIFNPKSTALAEGMVHFKPIKIDLKTIGEEERDVLVNDLEAILKALKR